ncbi:hypothetical protein DdX_17200 [Ditylenchus destructor]|uniref:Uncharacterized protein n=1 Tax=Ditylenchus destructor TaxID=166010 RepID=A0AAD4MLT7_9BILA|nr:hypothetical protein DdX_17200 [Ditylenchus destructor]
MAVNPVILFDVLQFSSRNDLEISAMANGKFYDVLKLMTSSNRSLPAYRFKKFHFTGLHPILAPALSADNCRNWEDSPCFLECQKHFMSSSLANSAVMTPQFMLQGGIMYFSPIMATLFPIHGLPIQFQFNENAKDLTQILHLLHLFWHIKDTVFSEDQCLLDFVLSRHLQSVQSAWGVGPLLKCTKSLKVTAHSYLSYFYSNIVPSSNEERLYISPRIEISVSGIYEKQAGACRLFLKKMIEHYQQPSLEMPSNVDISCGPLVVPINSVSGLVELTKLQTQEGSEAGWEMVGEFVNDSVKKVFHVSLRRCFVQSGYSGSQCRYFRFYSLDLV